MNPRLALASLCFFLLLALSSAEPPVIEGQLSNGKKLALKSIRLEGGSLKTIGIDGSVASAPLDRFSNLSIDLEPYLKAVKENDELTSRVRVLEADLAKAKDDAKKKEEMLKNVVGGAKEQSNQRSDQAALINQLEARVAELENQLKEQTAIPSPRTGATSRPANRTAIGAPTSKPSSSPKSTSSPAYGVCPKGGFHVPGTIDSKGKLHCAKCGQFM